MPIRNPHGADKYADLPQENAPEPVKRKNPFESVSKEKKARSGLVAAHECVNQHHASASSIFTTTPGPAKRKNPFGDLDSRKKRVTIVTIDRVDPHGAAPKSSTCKSAPRSMKVESPSRSVNRTFVQQARDKSLAAAVTAERTRGHRTPSKGIKSRPVLSHASVALQHRASSQVPYAMQNRNLDASPRRILRRPRRWLAGAPGGWWPSEVETSSSDDDSSSSSERIPEQPTKKRRIILEASSGLCATTGTSSSPGLSSPWSQPRPGPHSKPQLPVVSSSSPQDQEPKQQGVDSDDCLSSASSTRAIASDIEDEYLQRIIQEAASNTSSGYSSANENRPTSTSPPIEPIARQRSACNAAHLQPVIDHPSKIEVITLSSSSDDEVQILRVVPPRAEVRSTMPINVHKYNALSNAFRADQSPHNAEPFLKYAKKLAFRKKEAIRAKKCRDEKKMKQQLNNRQLQSNHQRLINELEEAIDIPVDAPMVEAAAPGAVQNISAPQDGSIATSLAGLSISTPTPTSSAQYLGAPATPYAYLFSPSAICSSAEQVNSVEDWLQGLLASPAGPVAQQGSVTSVLPVSTEGVQWGMPSSSSSTNTNNPTSPIISVQPSTSTSCAPDAMSPASPRLDDMLVLQPCAQDTSGQYVVEVLQPDAGATNPPIRIRIRRALQEEAPMLIDDPATTTEEDKAIITSL
ncbi:hypothetical protein QAD02_000652 [Eretmocerus hayati]|uniref:Uncharacterized protein n=1 Tax=Eretmocerus hayati TaxID=131215 RepID=A0ACC2NF30_9HYME|nr:hypothetical protein QAD02_000652 [Eretmocerus hayati]